MAIQESQSVEEEKGIESPYPYLNPESREWGSDEEDEDFEDDGDEDGDDDSDGGGVLARCLK